MHRSLARYSAPASFVHAPFWADFITTMVGFKFSVHTVPFPETDHDDTASARGCTRHPRDVSSRDRARVDGAQPHRRLADVAIPRCGRGSHRLASCASRQVRYRRGRHHTAAQATAWRRVTDFIRGQGAAAAIQLGHAGRKVATRAPWDGFSPLGPADAEIGRPPWSGLAPSPIPFKDGAMAPKEMDRDDIRKVIALHVEAAKRSDAYGGELDARMRFGLELIEAVRAAWPADRPLFFRGSCVDGRGGAWSLEDTIVLAKELKQRGVDVFDCSSGGIDGPLTLHVVPRVPGYHVPFARRIRAEVSINTMAVGLITKAAQAESYLEASDCDFVALAREMLWNPNWPIHAAKELGVAKPHELLPPHYAWWLQKREE